MRELLTAEIGQVSGAGIISDDATIKNVLQELDAISFVDSIVNGSEIDIVASETNLVTPGVSAGVAAVKEAVETMDIAYTGVYNAIMSLFQ